MSRALDFFRKSTARDTTAAPSDAQRSEVAQAGAQNSSDCSHARLKRFPELPEFPGAWSRLGSRRRGWHLAGALVCATPARTEGSRLG
jgi:hypothetical protein